MVSPCRPLRRQQGSLPISAGPPAAPHTPDGSAPRVLRGDADDGHAGFRMTFWGMAALRSVLCHILTAVEEDPRHEEAGQGTVHCTPRRSRTSNRGAGRRVGAAPSAPSSRRLRDQLRYARAKASRNDEEVSSLKKTNARLSRQLSKAMDARSSSEQRLGYRVTRLEADVASGKERLKKRSLEFTEKISKDAISARRKRNKLKGEVARLNTENASTKSLLEETKDRLKETKDSEASISVIFASTSHLTGPPHSSSFTLCLTPRRRKRTR